MFASTIKFVNSVNNEISEMMMIALPTPFTILMIYYISNGNISKSKKPLLMKDILCAMVKCNEIQGVLALDSFNMIGLDHVVLVKIATTAVTCHLLGGSRFQILNALNNGHPLRAVKFSLMSMTGKMGK
ncbi:hypothetical protein ACTFIY_002021 [Dictyostelium cf. discoideum]